MTPEERTLQSDLFRRLREVETQQQSQPRDAEAEDFIRRAVQDQPLSSYYMAQTVLVQRRRRVLADVGDGVQKRILRTSRGRKLAADIAKTYSLKVKARAPHPFIFIPNAQEIATQRLADFWSQTLARAGA